MIPTLHLFNPDNDLALANNNENYQSPASARKMAADLSVLPAWWAGEGEAVLVSSIAEAERWWRGMEALQLPAPLWYSLKQPPAFEQIKPWGWNPALCKQMLLWGVPEKVLHSVEEMQTLRTLSSRLSAVTLLPRLRLSESFCGTSVYATTETALQKALEAFPRTVLKAPYSGSGKGLRFGYGSLDAPLANWCRRIIAGQGGVVVEPLYNKVMDFAMEFKAEKDKVRFVGYSLFRTNANGAYEGNLLASDAEIERLLCEKVDKCALLQLRSALALQLAEWLIPACYEGYLGVDMMVCAFPDAPCFRIHPCVEINLRMNMGVVARLFYDGFVAEGAEGSFVVEYCRDSGVLVSRHLEMCREFPLRCVNGRICSGYLALVPVTSQAGYRVYIRVG